MLESVAVCGPGALRPENQDNYFLNGMIRDDPQSQEVSIKQSCFNGTGLFVVADGMGGEQFGELASHRAVSVLKEMKDCSETGVRRYLQDCNEKILEISQEHGGVRVGTTIVGLHLSKKDALLFNVGDSRAYMLRDRQLVQLSHDHTLVGSLVESGILTPEAARIHPDRHKVTQYLGVKPEELIIEPYLLSGKIQKGDLFLLCSDGLTEMVEEETMQTVLCADLPLKQKAQTLYQAAMEAGGTDNITVLLIQTAKGWWNR